LLDTRSYVPRSRSLLRETRTSLSYADPYYNSLRRAPHR
jgi:hypothetical protein